MIYINQTKGLLSLGCFKQYFPQDLKNISPFYTCFKMACYVRIYYKFLSMNWREIDDTPPVLELKAANNKFKKLKPMTAQHIRPESVVSNTHRADALADGHWREQRQHFYKQWLQEPYSLWYIL